MSYSKLHDHDFAIQIKSGLAANINATATKNVAVEGEPHWATDTNDLYVFDGAANQLIGGASTRDANGDLLVGVYTDGTRPAAATAGRIIFNSDDGQLNIDTGAAWTLPDGTAT